jgi:hypothetical protein
LIPLCSAIVIVRVLCTGGATMWPLIFHMFMTSLILFQLAMIVRLPPPPLHQTLPQSCGAPLLTACVNPHTKTWQGILTLSKFGGGGALVALPFITAGIWVLLHFHWVTVSNSGPINGTSTEGLC